MEMKSRRSALAKSVELISTVPLITLVAQNFFNRTSYYSIEGRSKPVGMPDSALNKISDANALLLDSSRKLFDAYTDAYHVRHTQIVPARAGRAVVPVTRVYYTWEEPRDIPNHNTIEGWKYSHENLASRLDRLAKEPRADINRLNELFASKQRTDALSEGLISTAIYAPQIAVLLLYEEAIAKLRHGSDSNAKASELVEMHDTSSQITRRSFFKVGAALAGMAVAAPITMINQSRLDNGKRMLEAEIAEIKRLREAGSEQVFKEYFSKGVDEIMRGIGDEIAISDKTADHVKNGSVRDAFLNYSKAGRDALNSFSAITRQDSMKELGDIVKANVIAKRLDDKSVSEHRAVYLGIGLAGAAVAGTMALTLIPLELLNEHFSNKAKKDPFAEQDVN